MRYIDLRQVTLPDGWPEKAKQALAEIEKLAPEDRNQAINRQTRIWHELKKHLENCSHGKCWFCESKQTRSDNAVDHFRPKGRVVECPEHKGYWWLAFTWENYRYSCTYCNSRRRDQMTGDTGGKQDHFPLLNETTRVFTATGNLEAEQHCLLDPTNATDPGLLWFRQDGEAEPRYAQEIHPLLHKRAEVSIELYHLNYHKTKSDRQILYNDIVTLVTDGDKYFDRFASGDNIVGHSLKRVVERLMDLINERAEFSAAAKAFLRGLMTNERVWLEQILLTA